MHPEVSLQAAAQQAQELCQTYGINYAQAAAEVANRYGYNPFDLSESRNDGLHFS